MSERTHLEHAIATLEAQRGLLGDLVVETALIPLREKLASLGPAPAAQHRKHATILFADVSGFTAMSETMDAEDVSDTMNALWQDIDTVITNHGGLIDKHMGDAVMALWGSQTTREDDPERAIRAALAMHAALDTFRRTHAVSLHMRIGINTGLVLLGPVGTTHEFTAMGDAVNLASRLEHAAPIGEILISHNTYRHVRGVFAVTQQALLDVKGKRDRIQTYVVNGIMPRAFRLATRGVEGIETRMIGREEELLRLQKTLGAVIADTEVQAITVLGEAGVGKSRLLYEFRNWIDLHPTAMWIFHGRATQEMRQLPYALLRDVFSFRFHILDSDAPDTARQKLEQGIVAFCGAEDRDGLRTAHLIGQLIGLDFSTSPYLSASRDNAAHIQEQALQALSHLFEAATKQDPAVLLLEDLHWADPSSLDALRYLIAHAPAMRLMILCMTRPILLEERPAWAEGLPGHTRLTLQPLTRHESRALVSEILRYVPTVPEVLREMIVGGAEGNPFYVEELIKMLIEEGVIVPGDEQWHIEHQRLATVHVPPTLSGVLQARLDALPVAERMLLQRAATFGRIFWASAVGALGQDDDESIQTLLANLRQRELIYRHETSAFEGTTEYMFRHALLREVVYEGTLKRQRHTNHHQAALWLEEQAGARVETYAGLIADHYALAEDAHHAGIWLLRAARQAFSATDPEAAITAAKRACIFLEGDDQIPALLFLGSMCDLIGEWSLADDYYHQVLARGTTDDHTISSAQASLGLGKVARKRGDYLRAVPWLNQALQTFMYRQDSHGCCQVLIELARIRRRQGNYAVATQLLEEASHLAQTHGLGSELASIYQTLGLLHQEGGRLEDAHEAFNQSFKYAQAVHHAERMGAALVSLGINALHRKDIKQAQAFLEDAYARYTDLASPFGVAIITINLGHVAFRRGALDTAQRYYLDGVDALCHVGDLGSATVGLIGVAAVLMANTPTEHQAVQATRLLAATTTILATIARVLDREDQEIFDATQQQIRAILTEDHYAEAWTHGTQLTMEAAISEAKTVTIQKN